MKKAKAIISLIILTVLLFTITPSQAQRGGGNNGNGSGNSGGNSGNSGNGPGGGNNGSGGGNGGGASLPINTGLIFLLIAGTVIGIKVVYNNSKKAEQSS